jgi:hypothetical protein
MGLGWPPETPPAPSSLRPNVHSGRAPVPIGIWTSMPAAAHNAFDQGKSIVWTKLHNCVASGLGLL